MAEVPDGFDLEALLAPIPGEQPAGADLREDYSPQSPYYRLRDARAEARASERAMDAGGEEAGVPPQWRTIRELGATALAERSKDLEIAAWLIEALLRSDGLPGITAGCRLMSGLAAQYWDGLYPRPDDEGVATQVAPVTGLNGEGGDGSLIQPLLKLPMFTRPDGTPLPYWQYRQAAETAAIGDAARREQRLHAGVLPFETVETEARAAGGPHFAALLRQVRAAEAAWQAMASALEERAGADGPPTSRVRDLLAEMREAVRRYAPADAAEPAPEPVAGEAGSAAAAIGAPLPAPDRLASREDALRMLGDLAEFFRRSEPHSPLAYTLQEAVRRGRMTWPELLAEIVPDQTTRTAILTSLGIRPLQE
jgi:type VI secretion system protein ImpA